MKTGWLIAFAAASIALWQFAEYATLPSGPAAESMRQAASVMQRASEVIRDAKAARGLLQGRDLDPNRTGLIGPEWSETVTTVGSLPAKRTLTNPDVAALMVRLFLEANLRPGDSVAVLLSGSFVGGNVAVLSAIESFGLRPTVISSVGASMYGAADPQFTWLDMENAVRSAGVWRARSARASLGGEAGLAKDLGDQGRRTLLDAVQRSGVRLLEGASFTEHIAEAAAALGLRSSERPRLLINVGGAQIALGDCPEAEAIPPGVVARALPCSRGTPGLIHIALSEGIAVLNIFKIKQLAQRYGLPLDPVPHPPPGRNRLIYGGAGRRKAPMPLVRSSS